MRSPAISLGENHESCPPSATDGCDEVVPEAGEAVAVGNGNVRDMAVDDAVQKPG